MVGGLLVGSVGIELMQLFLRSNDLQTAEHIFAVCDIRVAGLVLGDILDELSEEGDLE